MKTRTKLKRKITGKLKLKDKSKRKSHWSVQCCLYLSSFFKYLACNFDDLELGLFKVIQCQMSWCQLKAHSWFPI